jgi:hypothetical protein
MKKRITYLLVLAFVFAMSSVGFAQPTHTVDFEPIGADWYWEVAENADNPPVEVIDNPVSGGINTSDSVAQFTARPTGAAWALCFTDDNGRFTFDADNSTVKIMVYKPRVSNVNIKFEGESGAHEVSVANTQTNQWEELTFDFSPVVGNTYERLVIIPDFAEGRTDSIIYFDNIQVPDGITLTLSDLTVDGSTIDGFKPVVYDYAYETSSVPTVDATTTDPAASYVVNDAPEVPGTTEVVVTGSDGSSTKTYSIELVSFIADPTTPAPTPVHDENADNVFSIYSDSYTDLENTNFDPNWGQATVVTYETIEGNNTLKYTNLNYQGTNLGSADGTPQDVSGNTHFHVDFWTPNATALNFFLISQSSGEVAYALPITTEQWVSVDIPLSYFSDQGLDLTDIFQFKVDGGDGTTTIVWFDNWYFHGGGGSGGEYPTHTVDFESGGVGADWYWEVAENDDNPPVEVVDNPVSGGINTSASVAQFTARPTGAAWALCFTDDNGRFTFDSDNSTVKIMVYKPRVSNVNIKFEGTSGASPELSVANTLVNEWEELTFDFSAAIGNTYERFILIPDFAEGRTDSILYFDNIQVPDGITLTLSDLTVDGSTIDGFKPVVYDYAYQTSSVPTVDATTTDPAASSVVNDAPGVPGTTEVVVTGSDGMSTKTYSIELISFIADPTTPAPTPTHDEEDDNVFSIYSDSYTDLENTNFNPNWGQSTVVTYEMIDDNNTLKYSSLNYQGTNLGSADGTPQDVSGHTHFHVDFWTPNATALNFFLISQSSGEVAYSLPITTEQWVSVDIPLSYFSDQGLDLTDIFQFKVDGGDGTTTIVWFDNWYFYGGESSVVDDSHIGSIPSAYTLNQNYPNPFNPNTTILFELPENAFAKLTVYDITGKVVKVLVNTEKQAGYHSVTWDGKDEVGNSVESGIYLYTLTTSTGVNQTNRMTLLK